MEMSQDISQMEELRKLAETNNNAVSMLENGDFEHAISNFARALNLARTLMTRSRERSSEKRPAVISFDKCMERSRVERVNALKESEMITEQESYRTTCKQQQQQQHGSFMYKTAMKVQPCDLPSTREAHVFMAVVLVFNAALAYQLAGDQLHQENLSNIIFVRKAIKLYRLAYNIYHEETIGASPYFCMAIVNNLGLLYQESQCVDKADKCFQHLLSTLMFLVDCHENMENFEGYFENTAHLFFDQNKRVAPAA